MDLILSIWMCREEVSGLESIIAALITGGITLLGVLIANGKSQAVTETKLDELDLDALIRAGKEDKEEIKRAKIDIG